MLDSWVSYPRFTVLAVVEGDRIVKTAPVTRRFVGQPLGNLVRWFRTFGPTRVVRLDTLGELRVEEFR